MFVSSRSNLISLSVAATMFATPAWSQGVDAKKLAALLVTHAEANGAVISFADARTVGNDVVLRGVELKADKGAVLTWPEVKLENVKPIANGGYKIGRLSGPASTHTVDTGKWTVGAWTLNEVLVPAEADTTSMAFYSEAFDMQPTQFETTNGKPGVQIGRIRWTASPFVPGKELKSRLEPFDIVIDPSIGPTQDPAQLETFKDFGISKLSLQFSGDGLWRPDNGRTAVTMGLNFRELGKLTTTMDLSGMTMALFKNLQTFGAKQAKEEQNRAPNGKPQMSPEDQAKIMEIVSQMSFNSMSLRLDDASFTKKAIDAAAKRAGQPRAQFLAQIKMMAPVFAAMLGDPKVSAQASAAFTAFLDNPKSLEIKAQPQQAASIMELFMLGAMSPQALIPRLNLQVTANK